MSTKLIDSLESQLSDLGISWGNNITEAVPPYFYDGKNYYFQEANRHFFKMNEQSLSRMLTRDGFVVETKDKKTSAPFITVVQEKCAVSYCGALAGFRPGPYLLRSGDRILVTRATKLIDPAPGDWSVIETWIKGMLDSGDTVQSVYFFGWLKVFLESYRLQMSSDIPLDHLLPGQCLILAGPVNVGKSLLIDCLLVPMFGGRLAKPLSYMSGKTAFNGDSAGAPLLAIDDEGAGRDRRSRTQFASRIKEYCFAPGLFIHGKYHEPIILKPCQRLIIAANDDADHITVLPTIDESMKAKLMLLRVGRSAVPLASGLIDDREKLRLIISDQIAAFMHYLLFEFKIPDNLKSERCGITHFHHPDLVSLLEDIDPDSQLLEAIDKLFAEGLFNTEVASGTKRTARTEPWEGSASEFERVMRFQLDHWQSSRFFRYENAAGMALRRLSQSAPSRVAGLKLINGTRRWRINPPAYAESLIENSTPCNGPKDPIARKGTLRQRLKLETGD